MVVNNLICISVTLYVNMVPYLSTLYRHATDIPGTAKPYIMPPRDIDSSFRYLVLMTDGVYKSIEGMFENQDSIEANKVLVSTIERERSHSSNFATVAERVVNRIAQIHHDTYQRKAREDVRSPIAVACRKRDDMTLLLYEFKTESV